MQIGETTGPTGLLMVHTHEFLIEGNNHVHRMDHAHDVSLPRHKHTITLPEHKHPIRLKSHTHKVDIAAHTHSVEPGIYLYGGCTGFSVAVNDEIIFHSNSRFAELDITEHLVKDNRIPRGRWHTVTIIPDNLAYVSMDMFVQGFVQSRGKFTV